MKLYKNVSKTLLSVKTPRRMYVEPGMIIDVDALGDIKTTDIAMFIDRGALVSVQATHRKPVDEKSKLVPNKGNDPVTNVVVQENKTVVVEGIVPDDPDSSMKVEKGRVSKSGSAAAVVSPPPDDMAAINATQNQNVTKGSAYDALPPSVKEDIAKAEKAVAAKEKKAEAPKKKATRKPKAKK